MKIIFQKNNQYILKISRGEHVISSLVDFCIEHTISAGWLQGLGAVDYAEISFYDLVKKEYIKTKIVKDCELLNMTGNIALVDSKPMVHAHATFGNSDYTTIGGHVHEMRVSATCEINLQVFDTEFKREYDDETGLKLLNHK